MIHKLMLIIVAAIAFVAIPSMAADVQPIKVLIITGDHGHAWKETTPFLKELLTNAGMTVDVTERPAVDLTSESLAKYDVLLLNYKDTPAGGKEFAGPTKIRKHLPMPCAAEKDSSSITMPPLHSSPLMRGIRNSRKSSPAAGEARRSWKKA